MAQDNQSSPPKYLYRTLATLALVAVMATGLVLLARPDHPFFSVHGLETGETATIVLETKGKAEPLAADADTPVQFSHDDIGGSYKISATLKNGNAYRDISFLIDAGNANVLMIADGFDAADKITMTLNGKALEENLSFDWSGKIELSALIPDKAPSTLCLAIASLSLCHALPRKQAA